MRIGSDSGNKASVSNSLVIFRTEIINFIPRCALNAHYSGCMLYSTASVMSTSASHMVVDAELSRQKIKLWVSELLGSVPFKYLFQ